MQSMKYHVKLTMITEMLGSQPTVDVATEFIAAKNDIELPHDEAMALPEALERGTTVFHKVDGQPVLFDYSIKGFVKEAARTLNGSEDVSSVKNLLAKVSKWLFIEPRIIPLILPEGGQIAFNERPLRAQTAQGPRVALSRSEQLPVGTTLEFDIVVLAAGKELTEKVLGGLLDYGYFQGLGQWRSGSWGRFEYTIERVEH